MKKEKGKITFIAKNPALFVFSAIVLFCGVSVFAQDKTVVRVSSETVIDGDRVMLGDIAEISGAGETKSARLKKISLGYAPKVGMTRQIFRDRILLSIAAAGFAKTEVSFIAPAKILVRRSALTVDRLEFREAVEKAVLAHFQRESVEAKIVKMDLPSAVQIPSGEIEVRAALPKTGNLFLPFSVALEILVDGKIVRRASATVQIEASAEILVAANDLISGAKISENAVKTEIRRLEKPLNSYLRDASKLRGTVLTKDLSAGAPLTFDAIAAGYVIRGGDPVRIVGESGKMQIIINGEARTSGRIGDRIAVKNAQSGAVLQAIVVDEGLVKVNF